MLPGHPNLMCREFGALLGQESQRQPRHRLRQGLTPTSSELEVYDVYLCVVMSNTSRADPCCMAGREFESEKESEPDVRNRARRLFVGCQNWNVRSRR